MGGIMTGHTSRDQAESVRESSESSEKMLS